MLLIFSAAYEFIAHFSQRQSTLNEKDYQVIKQIRTFFNQSIAIIILGGDDRLGRFLSNLLKNLVQPLIEEVCGVGAFGPLPLSRFDKCVEILEDLTQSTRVHH